MKKIFLCLLLLISFQVLVAQTRTLKSYKSDKSTIVKDSTGNALTVDQWYDKVQSNDYTLESITAEGVEPREFRFRVSTPEEKRMAMLSADRKGPITLAGFTTGKALQDFTVTDINGRTYTKDAMKGKVLVINFWFKDAAPCKAEIPELNKLTKKFKGNNVVFLAPTYDPSDDVIEFLKKNPFNFVVCADVDQMIIDMKIGKYPTHVVVDQQGIVQYVSIGQTDNIFDRLNFEISNLL